MRKVKRVFKSKRALSIKVEGREEREKEGWRRGESRVEVRGGKGKGEI